MKKLLEKFEVIANNIGKHDQLNGINFNVYNFSDATHIFND